MHRTINDWRLCLQTATTGHKHHTYIQYTYAHPFNGPFSGTTQVSRYQKGKTNRKQETASGSGISWAVCKSAPRSRQPRQHPTSLRSFLQTRCPSCRPTNSAKALKVHHALYRTTLLRGTHSEQSANCNDMEKSAWILPEKLSQFQHKTASL